MGIEKYIARQFHKPTGLGGHIVSARMNRQNQPLYEATERLLTLSASERVLDIGCGNGYVMNMLAARHSCVFTGIDISKSILKAAARRNRLFLKKGVMRFSQQNVGAMSFADASFDKVYTINTMYFWDNLDATIAEIRRVMRPNGLFVNTVYSNETLNRLSHTQFGYKQFTIEQINNAGEKAGFAVSFTPVLNGAAYCISCKSVSTGRD